MFAPTAGARSSIFPELCVVVGDGETILKGADHFLDPTHIFPTGCTEKYRAND